MRELVKNFEDIEEKAVVKVEERTDIPVRLRDTVETILIDTIGHLLDGREIVWQEGDREGTYLLTLIGGYPEVPGFLGEPPKPPYAVREQFEGLDGSGEGLHGNLPDNWQYEPKNRQTTTFYRE